jgi:hypothetical protein
MLKTPLDHALALAMKGFAVFPVSTDKTPLVRGAYDFGRMKEEPEPAGRRQRAGGRQHKHFTSGGAAHAAAGFAQHGRWIFRVVLAPDQGHGAQLHS